MSFALKIERFTKPAKNRMSPTQAKPKNKRHASPAFAILVAKDAEVRADFGDGFEKPGQQSRKNSGTESIPWAALGKLGMLRRDRAERVKKDKQSTQVKERRDLNLKINTLLLSRAERSLTLPISLIKTGQI